MSTPYDDPREVERAKARAAGDLGQAIVRFPLQFAQPALIGSVPDPSMEAHLHNGTATLIRLEARMFAVTCEHVIRKFRELREAGERKYVFQIGMLELDPEERVTAIDKDLDMAVLDITGLRHRGVSVRGADFQFHEPTRWPPEPPSPDEMVAFAGFPGSGREEKLGSHIDFDTFALGAQPVTSSHRARLAFQFERQYWVSSYGRGDWQFSAFSGMSGGPVMVMRALHWDLAGVITHFSEMGDILFAAPAVRLRFDGTLDPD